jgi:hypothetical protein
MSESIQNQTPIAAPGDEPQGKTNTLASSLWHLAAFVRSRVVEAKGQNTLIQTSETYVRPKILEFEYKEGGSIHTKWSTEYFEKSSWHWKHQRDFIQRCLTTAPRQADCSEILKKEFAVSNNQALYNFVQKIAFESTENLQDDRIVELVSIFLSDLNKSLITIRVVAWMDGFWLRDDHEITISDFVIRRPAIIDLQIEKPLHLAIHGHSVIDVWGPHRPAILEFSIRGLSTIEAQDYIETITNVLRLYRLGSVKTTRYQVIPESILSPSFMQGSPHDLYGPHKYALGPEDREPMGLFFRTLKPLVEVKHGVSEPQNEPAYLAFLKYTEAVLAGGVIEGRITSAISCLEALYLKGEERSELSHKLSLRVASLLRVLDFNPLEIQSRIHRAYEIRSTHIHGGQVDKERLKDSAELCQRILEYARISVIIFLQLHGKFEKDEFINKLDRALLEPKSLDRVRNLIASLIVPK